MTPTTQDRLDHAQQFDLGTRVTVALALAVPILVCVAAFAVWGACV